MDFVRRRAAAEADEGCKVPLAAAAAVQRRTKQARLYKLTGELSTPKPMTDKSKNVGGKDKALKKKYFWGL